MTRLVAAKLHTRFNGLAPGSPLFPRCYTLTHSDQTGDLFLTIGPAIDHDQISGWYTRLMRDEVTAEWQQDAAGPTLHVFCHVSGGFIFGSAYLRDGIFRRELPLVLEAFRYGDSRLYSAKPTLDQAAIWVHFQSVNTRYHKIENWGRPADYVV